MYDRAREDAGIGAILTPVTWDDKNYFPRIIFDLTFFILIPIILLNIVFGIILDTVSERIE